MSRFVITLVTTLSICGTCVADDPEGHRGQGHDQWHKGFYETLQTPDTKVSCCNLGDCRPTTGRETKDGYEVKVDNIWTKVLPNKIVKKTAPDWGFHVCARANFSGKPEHVHCVVVPPEN